MGTLEWDLVRGIAPSQEAESSRAGELARAVVEADFKAVLSSDEARALLSSTPDFLDGLDLRSASDTATSNRFEPTDPRISLVVAVALLHSFVQLNWTGPDLAFTPLDLLPPNHGTDLESFNAAALPFLTLNGEPGYHLAQHPALFLLARRIFASLHNETIQTLPWWKLRVHLIHQSLLDEAVSVDPQVLADLTTLRDNSDVVKNDQDLLASLDLEIGLYHHSLGLDKPANREFLSAAKASGLEFELSGALGRKTKYQPDPISQLILLAESRPREGDEPNSLQDSSKHGEEEKGLPTALLLNDDTLLEETEFTKMTSGTEASGSTSRLSHLEPSAQPPLHPLDQSLLLSFCLSQHNHLPSSGLTASQMMPFLTRVLQNPHNWSIHTTALLLRSRLESTRSRTVERSALQLQALIEQMPTSDSSPKERLRYFYQLPLPSKWEMEKELAKRFISLGVTRSALDIFSRLEMWEDAVGCLQRLEKEEEAEKIVRDLLEGRKIESDLVPVMKRSTLSEVRRTKLTSAREAKLWCLLGDLALDSYDATRDPGASRRTAVEHYEKAWEVSGHTSSRAMRSIGSLKFGMGEFESSIPCLKHAVEINPLYSRVWFTLGVSFVKLERWTDARDAFRRLVNVDEEDAEGWNNLAAVYLRIGEEGHSKEEPLPPVSFDNKLLAFRALRQGLRHAHHNWRMWQNYMIIAIDVGELSESARAMTRVIEEINQKDATVAINNDVLDKLVDSVTREDWNGGTPKITTSNEGFGLLPIVDRLFDHVILPRVSDSPRVWRSHARLLRWKEDWGGAMEDYLRAYRCGVAQDPAIERDSVKWREAVDEIEELVTVLSALGPKVVKPEGEKRGDWKFQAKGIVRTFMGRTRQSYVFRNVK